MSVGVGENNVAVSLRLALDVFATIVPISEMVVGWSGGAGNEGRVGRHANASNVKHKIKRLRLLAIIRVHFTTIETLIGQNSVFPLRIFHVVVYEPFLWGAIIFTEKLVFPPNGTEVSRS